MSQLNYKDIITTAPWADQQQLAKMLASPQREVIRHYIQSCPVTFEFPKWQITLYSAIDLESAQTVLNPELVAK